MSKSFLNDWDRVSYEDLFSTDRSWTGTPPDLLLNRETSAVPESKEVEVSIIPKLKETNEITLSDGDTLVAFIDYLHDKEIDSTTVEHLLKMLERQFPNNKVLILPSTVELGVIHEQSKSRKYI